MPRRRRFALGVLSTGYVKLVVAAVQLAIIPVLAIKWGLVLYGQWLMLVTIPMFLAASDFGFSTAASNRIIGEVARGERGEALVTFQSALRMILLLTGGIAALAVAGGLLLPDSMLAAEGGMSGVEARTALLVMVAYGLMTLQEMLFAGVSRAEGKQAAALAIRGTIMLFEGIAILLVVLFGGSPVEAAVCYLVIRTAGIAWAASLARRSAPWMRIGFAAATRDRLRELLRPAISAMVLPLSVAAYLQGTALAIGLAAGPAAVPLFTSLRTASRVGLQLVNTLVVPLMPEITSAHARGDERLLARMAGLLLMVNGLAGPIFGAGVVFFGAELLELWTQGVIQPPQAMITLMGISLTFAILWYPMGDMLLAINKHETYSYAFAVVAIGGVALTWILTRSLGVTGAGAANLAVDSVMFAIVVMSLRRNIGKLEFSRAAIVSVLPAGLRLRLEKKT
jgi:O-antigen/teichoic acid export membrane protein